MQDQRRRQRGGGQAGPATGPRDGGEHQQVHDLVEVPLVAATHLPGPVQDRELHEDGPGEERSREAARRGRRPGGRHPAGSSSSGSTDEPVAFTAALTAAATVWETSGWNTLGTM